MPRPLNLSEGNAFQRTAFRQEKAQKKWIELRTVKASKHLRKRRWQTTMIQQYAYYIQSAGLLLFATTAECGRYRVIAEERKKKKKNGYW